MPELTFTAEQFADILKLLEVEKIRKKKVLYSQLMDSLDAEGFAGLYTEDAIGEWGPYGVHRGRAKILEGVKTAMAGQDHYPWLHITTNMWIELLSPTTAVSRCYLHDVLTKPETGKPPLGGMALYEEGWVKIDDEWKINHHRIHWLWPERQMASGFPRKIVPTSIG